MPKIHPIMQIAIDEGLRLAGARGLYCEGPEPPARDRDEELENLGYDYDCIPYDIDSHGRTISDADEGL